MIQIPLARTVFRLAAARNTTVRRGMIQAEVQHGFHRDQHHKHHYAYACPSSNSYSTLASSSLLLDRDQYSNRNRKKKHLGCHLQNQQQQKREYVPLVVAVVVGGCWVAYRKMLGKPLTPDESDTAQEVYRKQQEELQQKNNKIKEEIEEHKKGNK